jgi:hypothetical protein
MESAEESKILTHILTQVVRQIGYPFNLEIDGRWTIETSSQI